MTEQTIKTTSKELEKKTKEEIVKELNWKLEILNKKLRFTIKANHVVLEIREKETEEIFLRMSPQKVMQSINHLCELIKLLDKNK